MIKFRLLALAISCAMSFQIALPEAQAPSAGSQRIQAILQQVQQQPEQQLNQDVLAQVFQALQQAHILPVQELVQAAQPGNNRDMQALQLPAPAAQARRLGAILLHINPANPAN